MKVSKREGTADESKVLIMLPENGEFGENNPDKPIFNATILENAETNKNSEHTSSRRGL